MLNSRGQQIVRGVVGLSTSILAKKKAPGIEPVGSTPGASRLCGVVGLSSILAKKRAPGIEPVLNSRGQVFLVPILGA